MASKRPQAVFGERLRELRLAHGWSTQRGFADHVGLDRTYVSGIERGRRNPTLEIIVKLARGLGVPPMELLTTLTIDDHHQRDP